MKRIGILYGWENSFPIAFVEKINQGNYPNIKAEAVNIGKLQQGEMSNYAVIIDRISYLIPFYKTYLKHAALGGTAVLNNPFWWHTDELFFVNSLAIKLGIPVPKTVILPSHNRPKFTSDASFRNLKYPLDWQKMFDYIKFPALLTPYKSNSDQKTHLVNDAQELWQKHSETGDMLMLLQENITYDAYFRCYYVGNGHIRIMPYEPSNPAHLCYATQAKNKHDTTLMATLEAHVLKLNQAAGFDLSQTAFGIRAGIPYLIGIKSNDFDADANIIGQENFEWLLNHICTLAIEKATTAVENRNNCTWGTFLTQPL